MKKFIFVLILLVLGSIPLSAESIDISAIRQERHFSQAVRQSKDYQLWQEMAHGALSACHRGELHFNATVLALGIQHCQLNDINPGLSLPEVHKYLAKDSYYQCQVGKISGNAISLRKYIKELNVPLNKIAPGFTDQKLIALVNKERAKIRPFSMISLERFGISKQKVTEFLFAFSIPIGVFLNLLRKYGFNRKERRHAVVILKRNLRKWAEHKFYHTNWPTRPIYLLICQKLE